MKGDGQRFRLPNLLKQLQFAWCAGSAGGVWGRVGESCQRGATYFWEVPKEVAKLQRLQVDVPYHQ